MVASRKESRPRSMLWKPLLAISLQLSLPANLLATPTLDELAHKQSCINGLQGLHDRIERSNRLWLTNPDSQFHIGHRFTRLQDIHSDFRKEVWRFAERFGHIPGESPAILQALKDLDQGMALVTNSATKVAIDDEKVALSLAAVNESYRLIGNEFLGLQEKCSAVAAAAVATGIAHVNEVRESLSELEGFISEASQKRGALSDAVYRGTRILLINRYAEVAQLQLDEASRRVDAVLAADVLNSNIQSWWTSTYGRNGLGHGLMGLHLQYFEPLSIMQNDLLSGQDLLNQIKGASGLEPAVLRALQQEISPKIESLQTSIETLQRRGPKGTLELQIATNSRRRTVITQYAETCLPALNEFELLLHGTGIPATSDSFNYNASEKLYADVVAACQRRTP